MDKLFKTIKIVHKKTGFLSFTIFFDILWSMIRYGVSLKEYVLFEFYYLNSNIRDSYVTQRRFKKINKKLVDESIVNVITDKKLFLLRFKDYVYKDIMCLNDYSYKEFENRISSYKNILARSNTISFIKSYKEFNTSNYRSPAYLEKELRDKKLLIIENKKNIHNDLKKINDLVIINVVSVYNNKCNIIASSIKFKDNDKIISGYVDINSGKIVGNLKDSNLENYKDYNGYKIPCFDKIIQMTKVLSHELEEIKQVEWSFIVDNKENVYLVDANVYNDYVFAQNKDFLNNKMGLMKYYNKLL